jgi:hypothetical protein
MASIYKVATYTRSGAKKKARVNLATCGGLTRALKVNQEAKSTPDAGSKCFLQRCGTWVGGGYLARESDLRMFVFGLLLMLRPGCAVSRRPSPVCLLFVVALYSYCK